MKAIFLDLSEQFLANGHRFKYYGIVRTVMEVGYEMARLGGVRFVIYSPAHGHFFEVTPRLDADSPTGVMDPGLPPEATPIRLRSSFPTRNRLRDTLLRLVRPLVRRINLRRWRHVPPGVARPVDMTGQTLISLGRPKIIADYLCDLEDRGAAPEVVPLVHDMIPLHDFAHRDQKVFTSNYLHDTRKVLSHARLVLTNSRFTRDEISHFAGRGYFDALPTLAPVPLSHELRPTQEPLTRTPPEDPYLICVGTLTGRKNLQCVMEALRLLHEQGRPVPRLVLAGARRKRADEFVHQSRFSGIADRVVFFRDPNQSELRALYERALALVIPSYMEGWGLPLGEALWVGTPGLSANVPALREVGGDLARYFDPDSPSDLAAEIDRLQSDVAERTAWRDRIAAGHNRLRSWKDVARDILGAAQAT
jgi:glycosyltransferase involved in cell wall biosynthesis